MMFRKRLPLVLTAILTASSGGRAGCLAPADTAIDVSVGSGPLWGNDGGSLLYARQPSAGHATLTLRPATGLRDDVAVEGDSTPFLVGSARETWSAFHSGTVNASDDVAFVASTTLPDDPGTPQNEHVARRGVYARSGNSLYEIARFGAGSPVLDVFNSAVPWGTLFDAVAADRAPSGYLAVVFSGQLSGQIDHRLGLFRWNEASPVAASPALLAGDRSPSGGSFFSFGRLRGNGPGDVVFFAVTKLDDAAPQVPGLYVLRPDGTKARIVKFGTDGDAAPGGGTFAIAGDFDVDDAGAVYFCATLQGAAAKTGLFAARAPAYTPAALLAQGDATPLAGTFGSFAAAAVRANADGSLVVSAPLSDDIGGDGLCTIAAGVAQAEPLVPTDKTGSVAALGAGRASYTTATAVRIVVPSDGSLQGPTDFRIVNLDLRNLPSGPRDTLKFEGRLQLPPWASTAPATFRGDATRFTASQTLSGGALTRLSGVRIEVASGPGNRFEFGIAGTDAAPLGTCKVNGAAETVTKFVVSADGAAAAWTFASGPAAGTFSVDLTAGRFKLAAAKATLREPYLATNFHILFALQTAADPSFFERKLTLNARQAQLDARGARVTSQGANTPGGIVFVDSMRVTRLPAKGVKPASDTIQAAGTLRLCPGTANPATPHLTATLRVGGFALDGVTMTRIGKSAAYRYAASGVDFRIDLTKATFTLKAASAPLSDLASAVAGSATNGPEHSVGGMQLAFEISIPRVYQAAFALPMVRLAGGKIFAR